MLSSFIAHIITKMYLSIKQEVMHTHISYFIDHTENLAIV